MSNSEDFFWWVGWKNTVLSGNLTVFKEMKSLEVFSIHYMRCFKVVVVLSSEPWEVLLIKKVLNIIFCQKIEQLQIKNMTFIPYYLGGWNFIANSLYYGTENKLKQDIFHSILSHCVLFMYSWREMKLQFGWWESIFLRLRCRLNEASFIQKLYFHCNWKAKSM